MQFLRMAWNETFIHIIYTNNILQQYINLKPPKHKTIKHVFVPVHVTNITGVTFYSWGTVMKTKTIFIDNIYSPPVLTHTHYADTAMWSE